MRFSLPLLAAACLLVGCGTPDPSPRANPAPPAPELDPRTHGHVVLVNAPLRYVVMEFGFSPLPALEQRLDILRDNKTVGIVKVTGPIIDTSVAGDIVSGQAQVGDEVVER